MSKADNVLGAIGLAALAVLGGMGAAAENARKEREENASLGTINIPSSEMSSLRGRRQILKVKGSEVRKCDPNSWISSDWLVWGAKFRPYMGKDVSLLEVDAVINPGETVPCKYKDHDGATHSGFVTIMETSRW